MSAGRHTFNRHRRLRYHIPKLLLAALIVATMAGFLPLLGLVTLPMAFAIGGWIAAGMLIFEAGHAGFTCNQIRCNPGELFIRTRNKQLRFAYQEVQVQTSSRINNAFILAVNGKYLVFHPTEWKNSADLLDLLRMYQVKSDKFQKPLLLTLYLKVIKSGS